MLASLALAVYLPAALARAALRGTVADGFAWREILGFIRANLGNYLLSLVIYLLAAFLAQFGFLLCCVGVFPAAFWGYLVLAVALGQTVRLSPVRVPAIVDGEVAAGLQQVGERLLAGAARALAWIAARASQPAPSRGRVAEREARGELRDPRERDAVGGQREDEAHVLGAARASPGGRAPPSSRRARARPPTRGAGRAPRRAPAGRPARPPRSRARSPRSPAAATADRPR